MYGSAAPRQPPLRQKPHSLPAPRLPSRCGLPPNHMRSVQHPCVSPALSPPQAAHEVPQLLQVLQLLPHVVHLAPALGKGGRSNSQAQTKCLQAGANERSPGRRTCPTLDSGSGPRIPCLLGSGAPATCILPPHPSPRGDATLLLAAAPRPATPHPCRPRAGRRRRGEGRRANAVPPPLPQPLNQRWHGGRRTLRDQRLPPRSNDPPRPPPSSVSRPCGHTAGAARGSGRWQVASARFQGQRHLG